MKSTSNFEELFASAAKEEMGLRIETNNPGGFMKKLTQFKASRDDLAKFMICIPSEPNAVYIIKKSVELE